MQRKKGCAMPKCAAEPDKPRANVHKCRSVRGGGLATLLKSQVAPVLANADVGVRNGRRGYLGAGTEPRGQRGGKDRLK